MRDIADEQLDWKDGRLVDLDDLVRDLEAAPRCESCSRWRPLHIETNGIVVGPSGLGECGLRLPGWVERSNLLRRTLAHEGCDFHSRDTTGGGHG